MKVIVLILVSSLIVCSCIQKESENKVTSSNPLIETIQKDKDTIDYESKSETRKGFLDSINSFESKSNVTHNKRTIIAVYGCDNSEILSDLEYSLSNNNFEKYGIKVISIEDSSYCGYIFEKDSIKKEIKTVKTDIELLDAAKAFFEIK